MAFCGDARAISGALICRYSVGQVRSPVGVVSGVYVVELLFVCLKLGFGNIGFDNDPYVGVLGLEMFLSEFGEGGNVCVIYGEWLVVVLPIS